MKMKFSFFRLSIFGTLCFLQTAYGQPDFREHMTSTNDILLRADEVSGVAIRRTVDRPWVTGIPPSAKPLSSHGVLQEVEVEGVKARIHYAEFDSEDDARQAAGFHINNMALIFRNGLWNGAKHKSIGDETWFARGPVSLAVLVRSGKTCFLISCREGDFEAQARIAEKLASRLTFKAKHGARVPVSGTFRE